MMHKQKGHALIFTLIIMSVVLTATLAMYRSSDSNTLVAGNIAFKQAASTAADIGVNFAMTTLNNITNAEVTVPNQYYAVQQPVDTNGIPTTPNWSQVPVTTAANNQIQSVIERLCSGTLPVTDSSAQCYTAMSATNNSKKVGSTSMTNDGIYYRVTVRVAGPKNTLSFIQAILKQS